MPLLQGAINDLRRTGATGAISTPVTVADLEVGDQISFWLGSEREAIVFALEDLQERRGQIYFQSQWQPCQVPPEQCFRVGGYVRLDVAGTPRVFGRISEVRVMRSSAMPREAAS